MQCQLCAATITHRLVIDGGRERGREGGEGEREIERGASITPLNLPVSEKGRRGRAGGPTGLGKGGVGQERREERRGGEVGGGSGGMDGGEVVSKIGRAHV